MENYLIELLKQNFNLDDFYAISLYSNDSNGNFINLQGHNTPEVRSKYNDLGYIFEPYNENWLTAKKNNIKITLT